MTNEHDEPARPEPEFRIYVEHQGDRTDVTHAVMDVYDIARNSMDFGSGFLSTEEVGNLRHLGKAINAKHFDYQHDKCLRCGHESDGHMNARPARPERACHQTGCKCPGFTSPHTTDQNG